MECEGWGGWRPVRERLRSVRIVQFMFVMIHQLLSTLLVNSKGLNEKMTNSCLL